MSFQPVLPLGGLAGWRFLSRTQGAQQAAMAKSAPIQRATEYFRANIGRADTAAKLVGDRRLLEVALTAYGLQDDLYAKAFIQRVLEGGTLESGALANKLADKRYGALAAAFDYGDLNVNRGLTKVVDDVVARYEAQTFQMAVGAKDDDLRLALNVPAALAEVEATTKNPRAQWFLVMGNPPLRQVFERALGLPASVGALDIDRQLAQFQARSEATFGTAVPGEIAGDAKLEEKLVRLFMLRSESTSASLSPGRAALQLLQRR